MDLKKKDKILYNYRQPGRQDKKILAKLKRKDQEAYLKAYDLYVDQIYRFVYFKISNSEEAEDITSLVFLKTWNYINENKLDDVKTLKALIYTIARTSVIDYYRQNAQDNLKIHIDNIEMPIDLPDTRQDVHKKVEIKSDIKIIENTLNKLKDEYREIIILKYIEELSIEEIADIIQKSKNNVRVLTHRAIKALKELIEEERNFK
ncbi:MAG: RNA polymerase sigma factor [Patescibacteria group bacterium]